MKNTKNTPQAPEMAHFPPKPSIFCEIFTHVSAFFVMSGSIYLALNEFYFMGLYAFIFGFFCRWAILEMAHHDRIERYYQAQEQNFNN
jgi:hypothetical protein